MPQKYDRRGAFDRELRLERAVGREPVASRIVHEDGDLDRGRMGRTGECLAGANRQELDLRRGNTSLQAEQPPDLIGDEPEERVGGHRHTPVDRGVLRAWQPLQRALQQLSVQLP